MPKVSWHSIRDSHPRKLTRESDTDVGNCACLPFTRVSKQNPKNVLAQAFRIALLKVPTLARICRITGHRWTYSRCHRLLSVEMHPTISQNMVERNWLRLFARAGDQRVSTLSFEPVHTTTRHDSVLAAFHIVGILQRSENTTDVLFEFAAKIVIAASETVNS